MGLAKTGSVTISGVFVLTLFLKRRELHSKNLEVVVAALTSISDLVHDPEKCYEAINLKIVDR